MWTLVLSSKLGQDCKPCLQLGSEGDGLLFFTCHHLQTFPLYCWWPRAQWRRRDLCAPQSCSLTKELEPKKEKQAELHIHYFNMKPVPDFTSKAFHVGQKYSVSSSESCFSYLGTDGAYDGKRWNKSGRLGVLAPLPFPGHTSPQRKRGSTVCPWVHSSQLWCSPLGKKILRFLLTSNTFWKFLIQWMTKMDFARKDFCMQRRI